MNEILILLCIQYLTALPLFIYELLLVFLFSHRYIISAKRCIWGNCPIQTIYSLFSYSNAFRFQWINRALHKVKDGQKNRSNRMNMCEPAWLFSIFLHFLCAVFVSLYSTVSWNLFIEGVRPVIYNSIHNI